MSERIQVTVIPNGPLKVSRAASLRYAGELRESAEDLYLCRCGESANAPFCDGSHRRVGFDDACPDAPEPQLRVWEGNTLRTVFNTATCMHVFYCKPLNELRARELQGDTEAAAEIIRVIHTCPSGALSYELKAPVEAPPPGTPEVAIDIIAGGEVRIQADFDINAPRMERQGEDRATLCRCGQSKNKPWCDGRHRARKDFR